MWQQQDNRLYREFTFGNFSEAFSFMTRVALLAERLDHHPCWQNEWNQVKIWLCTHDAGNTITEKDRHMAAEIDLMFA